MAYMRFKADKDIMNAPLVPLRKNTGAGGRDNGGEQPTESQPSWYRCGYALRWRFQSRLAIALAAQEDDGRSNGRAVRGIWPYCALPSSSNSGCYEQRYRDYALQLRRVKPARVLLRYTAPSSPQLRDSLHRLPKEQSHRSPDLIVMTRSESIERIMRRRRVIFAGFAARIEDTTLPDCVMFEELAEGPGFVVRQENEWIGGG